MATGKPISLSVTLATR